MLAKNASQSLQRRHNKMVAPHTKWCYKSAPKTPPQQHRRGYSFAYPPPPLKPPHDRNNSCFLQSHRFRPFCSANRGDQTRPNHAPRKLRRKPTWRRSSSKVGFATFAQVDGRPNGRVLFLSLFFSLSLSLLCTRFFLLVAFPFVSKDLCASPLC